MFSHSNEHVMKYNYGRSPLSHTGLPVELIPKLYLFACDCKASGGANRHFHWDQVHISALASV